MQEVRNGIALSGDKWYNDATWNVTYVDSHDYAPDQAPSNQRFAGSQDTWAENLEPYVYIPWYSLYLLRIRGGIPKGKMIGCRS